MNEVLRWAFTAYFLVFEIMVPVLTIVFVRGTKASVTNAWVAEWAVLAYWWK